MAKAKAAKLRAARHQCYVAQRANGSTSNGRVAESLVLLANGSRNAL